jgi:hypothetical protein
MLEASPTFCPPTGLLLVYTLVAYLIYTIVEKRSTQPPWSLSCLDDPKATDGLELSNVCRRASLCLELGATVAASVPRIIVRDHHDEVELYPCVIEVTGYSKRCLIYLEMYGRPSQSF